MQQRKIKFLLAPKFTQLKVTTSFPVLQKWVVTTTEVATRADGEGTRGHDGASPHGRGDDGKACND
jgi:hypothetical protein